VFYAVQFRFSTTSNCTARNNLADAPIHLRDSATAILSGNLLTATPGMFVNAAAGDLHLVVSATNAIDKAPSLLTVTNDFDGERRPRGAAHDIGADEFNTNAPPRISSFALSNNHCIVAFTTLAGLSYDVQSVGEVAGGVWSLVSTNVPGTGDLLAITDTNAASETRRFYRVRLSP
jgi:hypothetical protein